MRNNAGPYFGLSPPKKTPEKGQRGHHGLGGVSACLREGVWGTGGAHEAVACLPSACHTAGLGLHPKW